jgi:hypothetical protein
VIAVGTAIASCTLLGSREIRQCETDEQCRVNEKPGLINARVACIDRLCSPRPLDAGGDVVVDAGPDGAIPCTNGCPVDPPSICVEGKCTTLLSDACPRLPNSQYRDVYQEDGALLIGVYVFQPLSAGAEVRSIEAAIQHINDQLPPQTRLAAVFCEKKSKLSMGTAQAAVDHLASRKVPLVIGQFEASELQTLETQGLTVWSTLGNSPAPALQGRPEYRFLVDELKKLAPGFGPALTEAVSRAETVHATSPLPNLKIRMVVSDQEEARLLAEALESSGLPILGGTTDYARVSPQLKSEFETALPDNGTTQKNLVEALPHVIIAIGGDEVGTLITKVEATMGADVWPLGTPRPIWVVTTRTKFNANALAAVPAVPTSLLRGRLIGVDFGGDRAKLATLLGALAGVKHAGSQDHLYDAMYAVTFAAMRAQHNRGTPRGAYGATELMRGLDEILQEPTTPDVVPVSGAFGLGSAVEGVQNGRTVHFVGTTGPWLFPSSSRVSRRNMGTSYFCFDPAQSGFAYYVDVDALKNGASCEQP